MKTARPCNHSHDGLVENRVILLAAASPTVKFAEKKSVIRSFFIFIWNCTVFGLLLVQTASAQPAPPGGGSPGGTNGGGGPDYVPPSYSSNQFWLEALPAGANTYNANPDAVTFILHDTTNADSYQLQTMNSLNDTVWTPQQIFPGANGQDWTSITFPMSNQTTLFFRAIDYSQDTTDSGLPDWWKIAYGLNPNSLSSNTNGVSDAYADPAGDGWTDLQKFENGMNPNTFYTPPPPTVTVASLPGSGAQISWEPSLGNVTGYIVYRNGSPITTVAASQTSYQDNSVSASANSSSLPYYQVVAQYSSPSGTAYSAASMPQTPATANLTLDVSLVRGPKGQWYLAAPNIPNTVTNLRVFAQPYYSEYPDLLFDLYFEPMTNFNSTASVSYWDFPTSGFTNNFAPIPQSFLSYYSCYSLSCVPMGRSNTFGPAITVMQGFYQNALQSQSGFWYNAENDALQPRFEWGNLLPFLDGTSQLRQNLVFQLESADQANPLQFSVLNNSTAPTANPMNALSDVSFLPNYAWANFHTRNGGSAALVDELKPFEDNYFYRNFVVQSTGDLNSDDGSLITGVTYLYGGQSPPPPPYVNVEYDVQVPNAQAYQFPSYAFAASGSTNAPAPILTTNSQKIFSTWPDYGTIPASYDSSGHLTFASGQYNIFGLPYQSLTEYYSPDGVNLYSDTFLAGQTTVDVGAANSDYRSYYPQVAAPQLLTVGYYFGVDNRDVLPGDSGFTPITGTTAPIIAIPGVPLLVGAWAEESIDGSTNTPGYLEQYFGTSYSSSIIGGDSTNELGVLSEYGEFFPTDPGTAILTTKTNFDGTYGTVNVPIIGLYADRNHDGVINTSFSGPDFCTPSRPFQFWINDDNDAGDTGGDDIPGEPASLGKVPNGVSGSVNGTRDLNDFFPVYVDIHALVDMTNANFNYANLTYRLSQADSALNFFNTTLTTNAPLQYLTDTNIALLYQSNQVTQITSDGVILDYNFFSGLSQENRGIILVEASTNTTAPLVLDVMTNGYILAEAQLPLNITGVEQMFRHKNLTAAVLGYNDGPNDRLTSADVPNALDDNGTNFVFLHGYNVNPNQARGWESEVFKRMYWSGSRARFYGITWDASYSQQFGYVSINLQSNVANAFLTAPYLAEFLNGLSGPNVVAAHSLGNMVVLSAFNDYGAHIQTHFMIDAAVALEAVDPSAFPNDEMIDSAWVPYNSSLYAANWHNLFGSLDYRSKLTWTGRFSSFNNA